MGVNKWGGLATGPHFPSPTPVALEKTNDASEAGFFCRYLQLPIAFFSRHLRESCVSHGFIFFIISQVNFFECIMVLRSVVYAPNQQRKQRVAGFFADSKRALGKFCTHLCYRTPARFPPPPQVTSGPHFPFTVPRGVSCWFHKQRSDRAPHRWAHDATPEWDDLSIPVHQNLPGDDSPTLQGGRRGLL